ncbi:MAG: hypothetical protein AB4290_28540 [Spirulina sp.]
MNKKQFKFCVILFVLAVFVVSSQSFAQTGSPTPSSSPAPSGWDSFFNTTFWQNVAVAILSAVLAFLSGYALAGLGKKKVSDKRLSYNLSIEEGLVKVEENIRQKVRVLYDEELIENLYDVRFEVENTGETVVKSQEIRFEFPEETRILDFSFNPEPQPEMKVEKVESGSGLKPHERKCKLGHIERGQSLKIQFTATNRLGIQEVTPHPFNEIGDVDFIPKSITKEISDKEQVVQFLSLSILYIFVPSALNIIPSFLSTVMSGLVRLSILFLLFRRIVPFSEILSNVIVRLASEDTKRDFGSMGDLYSSVLVRGDRNKINVSHREEEEPDSSS